MAALFLRNPPAVPALMSRSGLRCCSAMYVLSEAGTVPTSSTPYRAHLPLVICVSE
jgi:hypothetical protein